jgi:hypothetical protein
MSSDPVTSEAELDSQDPFQICGGLCQTRKTQNLAILSKTDPTETVALCFGYLKTPCLRAELPIDLIYGS